MYKRQPLSPYLFNFYVQKTVDKVREEVQIGIEIHGERTDMLRLADDVLTMIGRLQDLQEILSATDRITEEDLNMKINRSKSWAAVR